MKPRRSKGGRADAPEEPRAPAGRRRARLRAWACVFCAIGAWLCFSALWACTVTQRNYKTLSFFFDGVPDPNAPMKATRPGEFVDIEQSPTYSAHKPWKEERCEECHARTLKLGNRDSDLCLKCHAETTSQHPQMHGPVAVGACLWCHSPHNSAYSHLLKAPGREVCIQCHAPNMLSSERVPAHAQENRGCLECHSGHGGDRRYFLRGGAS